jgi:phosphonate transport system substrate-binding protein
MNPGHKMIIAALAAVLAAIFILNYFYSGDTTKNEEIVPGAVSTNVTISIGTVSEDAVKQIKTFQPTADYIAEKLSTGKVRYEGKVIIAKTIDNMSDFLIEQKPDLFFDTPFAATIAANKSGSVPFLRRWRDGVPEYHSVFIVKKNSSIKKLNDFYGKTIAFEDPGSTSAYLLPKAYLIQKGFNLSEYPGKNNISYAYSGADENTPVWIIEGKADIGAISNVNFENYPDSIKDKITIIERTKNVPRHVVSHRSGLEPEKVEKIKEILLNMDRDPKGIEILKNFKTGKYDELPNKEEFMTNISMMIDLLN